MASRGESSFFEESSRLRLHSLVVMYERVHNQLGEKGEG
jgi:hypothetical protein